MSADQIPVVDISPFQDGTDQASRRVAQQVDHACREIGFLVIEGHGVTNEIVGALHNAGRNFFDLSEETKRKYETGPESYYGYNPMASSSLAYSADTAEAKPDLREAFASCRPDIATGDPYFRSAAVKDLGYDIAYPTEVEDFHKIWTSYYYAMSDLGAQIMRIFAVALDMAPDFFESMLTHHASNLALFACVIRTIVRHHHCPFRLVDPGRAAGSICRRLDECAERARHICHQSWRHDGALDERPMGIDRASCRQSRKRERTVDAAAINRVFSQSQCRRSRRMRSVLQRSRRPAQIQTDHGR